MLPSRWPTAQCCIQAVAHSWWVRARCGTAGQQGPSESGHQARQEVGQACRPVLHSCQHPLRVGGQSWAHLVNPLQEWDERAQSRHARNALYTDQSRRQRMHLATKQQSVGCCACLLQHLDESGPMCPHISSAGSAPNDGRSVNSLSATWTRISCAFYTLPRAAPYKIPVRHMRPATCSTLRAAAATRGLAIR
jgi:hypothetical protein